MRHDPWQLALKVPASELVEKRLKEAGLMLAVRGGRRAMIRDSKTEDANRRREYSRIPSVTSITSAAERDNYLSC